MWPFSTEKGHDARATMSRSPQSSSLQPGDKVLHRHNRELGPGVVESASAARVRVRFPRSGETLEFALASHPFVPLVLPEGTDPERWFEHETEDVLEGLARLHADDSTAFRNRIEALELRKIREAHGLGSFLGGRIRIYPHQLHVALRATARDPVRWLLADEVGLGKTIEACLILSHLLRTGRAERVLIVAPRSLVVQWLGELYRKFHQVFVLIDDERRRDVLKEKGRGMNPFEVFPRSVVALEDLAEKPDVVRLAEAASPDLLVVDEAHRLRRPKGSAGSPAYQRIAPLVRTSKHALLLTATPLEADTHGFYRLLELLYPEEFASEDFFEESLKQKKAILPCTSDTRRTDIGGLPPRVLIPVELAPDPERLARERAIRERPIANVVQAAERVRDLEQFLLDPEGENDARILWLAREAKKWEKRGEKALVFVHRRESLQILKRELEYRTSGRVGIFHEDLSTEARDLEVARFADPEGPALLIATESGGEGRNFQFARRLVLFDLPWDPALVEQRIGRLDRIDRTLPVEIVSFRPQEGFAAQVARVFESLGIYEEPLSALDRELGGIAAEIRKTASEPDAKLDIEGLARATRTARETVRRAAFHHLHRERYSPDQAPAILARIPSDLEPRTETVVLEACRQYGFLIEAKGGKARWYLEFGPDAIVETLHGVALGNRWLGTFDREEAVAYEALDFFASGHPLVEAVLEEIVDGGRGQVALQEIPGSGFEDLGVLFIESRGPEFQVKAFDLQGREHPEWVDLALHPRGVTREIPPGMWRAPQWEERVRALSSRLTPGFRLIAACGVRFVP
jgi:ATP-dependent helicase HepA